MANTAQLLGLSSSQLTQRLQSGSSLSGLASNAGVSQSSLINAIVSDLQANAPQGAPTLSKSQLSEIATNIANRTGAPGGLRGHHHHHGGGMPPLVDTAELLGLTPSELSQDLQSGTTLSSLASQAGVSQNSLISAIQSDLQSNAPQGAPALSGSALTAAATNIASGSGPPPPTSFAATLAQLTSAQTLT